MKLIELKRFINHKNKVPFVDGHFIKWSDESNWITYDEAVKNAKEQNLGVSIVLGKINDDYTLAGVDFDTIQDTRKGIIDFNIKNDIQPFTHKHNSISGYGIHILCLVDNSFKLNKGNRTKIESKLNINRLDENGNKKIPEIEFYTEKRLFCIPIDLNANNNDIIDSTKEYTNLYNKYMKNVKSYQSNKSSNDESRKDFKIIAKMVKKGYSKEEIQKLFLTSDYALDKDDDHKKKLFERDDYLDRTIDNAVDKINEEENNSNAKMNNVLNLIKDKTLFIDEKSIAYVIIDYKNVPIYSSEFEEYIENLCYDNNINLSNITLSKVQKYLSFQARKNNNKIELNIRFAGNDNEIYYQLNEKEVVKITSNGYEIIPNEKILFRWYKNMLEQVKPKDDKSIINLYEIFNFINVPKSQRLIFMVYIISLFIPNIPKPILNLSAERGSGKTTATKLIKSLVDPSVLETSRMPRDEQMLTQILEHSALINFDNISQISINQSDILCRAYSGEHLMSRLLYSNDDEFIQKIKRAIILNGINCPIKKSDLMDRTILIDLKRINTTDRKTENEIYKKWNEKKSNFLHEIFVVISKSFQIYHSTKLPKLERFADWQVWGYAIAEALKEGLGQTFMEDVKKVVSKQNEEVVENNTFIQIVLTFMANKSVYTGTTKELLSLLKIVEFDYNEKVLTTTSVLSKNLGEQLSVFESQGLIIERSLKGPNNKRLVRITNKNLIEEEKNEKTNI